MLGISKKKYIKESLELSIFPTVLISSCCISYPILALMGTYLSENYFVEYKWSFRLLGLLVLLISLLIFFRKRGIRNLKDYRKNRQKVWIISIQTLVFGIIIYGILLYYFGDMACSFFSSGTCSPS